MCPCVNQGPAERVAHILQDTTAILNCFRWAPCICRRISALTDSKLTALQVTSSQEDLDVGLKQVLSMIA